MLSYNSIFLRADGYRSQRMKADNAAKARFISINQRQYYPSRASQETNVTNSLPVNRELLVHSMLCSIDEANANVTGNFASHHGPSLKSHLSDSDLGRSTMSAKKESYHDSVQTVKDVIKIELINNIVMKLQANSTEPTEDITTRLDWTSACDNLLQFYRTEVHPKVVSEINI